MSEGEVYVMKTVEPGQPQKKVADYSAGSYFGELEIIRGVPSVANVIAKVRLPYTNGSA